MSRSYYALFHTLMPLVEILPPADNEHVRSDGLIGHDGVRERMREWRPVGSHDALKHKAKAVSLAFEKCRKMRVTADYDLTDMMTIGDAKQHMTLVQRTMTEGMQLRAAMQVQAVA